MIFRIYHKTVGGHVHMRFFSGRNDGALGKCGDLVMRTEEFISFRNKSDDIRDLGRSSGFIDFREEDNGT